MVAMRDANDTAFEMAASAVRYGPGVTREVGMDAADRGLRRVMVVTDPILARLTPVETVLESLHTSSIEAVVYDRVRVEPSDASFIDAIDAARREACDGFVAVGGGSVIDTAKAANLYTSYPPAHFLDYVNAPIGKGMSVPGPLKPLFAIPTTAGTGSETTGVAVFDLIERHVKTGISSRYLKPTLGYLDPDHTRTLPSSVAASAGLDVLCHAVESYTVIPFTERPRPARPSNRPSYQGTNPISDVWALQAMRMVAAYLVRSVDDPDDIEARGQMMLAASFAGIGFGNAGVHLPHAMAYPVAGGVKEYRAPGYPSDHALVPHGFSVVLNAPVAFRFTASASPERHRAAAEALGADAGNLDDAGCILSDRITWFMQRLNAPIGLRTVGYSSSDIPALVEGTLAQERLTRLSPGRVDADTLARLFEEAMTT
ncbi:MAG TPA: hydroxyacid-oxoacid transhydrogenase [Vicinamibacterales bacterium]|nr:hydroxyacid-oxoacid transhydrogenase [Vicinamibacterales bacterium]